jgi:hypothetical protein
MEKDWEARFNPPERHLVWSRLASELLWGLLECLPIWAAIPFLFLAGIVAWFKGKEHPLVTMF